MVEQTSGKHDQSLIEISEPYRLEDKTPVHFKARFGSQTPFYFEVKEPCIVKVTTWPLVEEEESEPDIFMTVGNEKVSCVTYTWQAIFCEPQTIIDSKEIVVYPDDPKYSVGTYHIVVQACNGSVEHSIGV